MYAPDATHGTVHANAVIAFDNCIAPTTTSAKRRGYGVGKRIYF